MIRKIKWNNYKALGNLELNFLKPDGTAYNTIILAGENGAGKTTILDTLSTFLNRGSVRPFFNIEYNIDGHLYRIEPSQNSEWAEVGFHTRITINSDTKQEERVDVHNRSVDIEKDINDLRSYGFTYSKARSGFMTNQVRSTTTQQLDREKYEPDNNEDFTIIKQLLIDIDAQDASKWIKQSEEKGLNDQRFSSFKKESKGYRFEKAFNDFFGNMQYLGVDNEDPDEKRILFLKHGQNISIDQLSTGEKQIVFRGAHMLRNMNSISGGIVLIDEPELSMHPIWQKKILQYYRGLFTNEGSQSVQMIVATHSEYVIQSALHDQENVLVIILTDEGGIITSRSINAPNVLPSITAAETNYLAFGVPSTDYHIELYGHLQTKTGKHSIVECDAYIAQQPQYDPTKHTKIDNSYPGHTYQTLPTYIRNAIDHPNPGRSYSEEELKISIELLMELCK